MKKIITILSLCLLSACSTTNNSNNTERNEENVNSKIDILSETPISMDSLTDITYILDSIDGYKSEQYKDVDIVFTQTKSLGNILRGNSGCNRYFAKYDTLRSVLMTSEIVSTKMRCPNEMMKIENFIFKIYSQRPVISLKTNQLIFETPTNKLIFKKK